MAKLIIQLKNIAGENDRCINTTHETATAVLMKRSIQASIQGLTHVRVRSPVTPVFVIIEAVVLKV